MASDQKRLSNNMAGIEFVACLETIKEFLHKSWKHTQIHRHLKDEGRITMSYGAFATTCAACLWTDIGPASSCLSPSQNPRR